MDAHAKQQQKQLKRTSITSGVSLESITLALEQVTTASTRTSSYTVEEIIDSSVLIVVFTFTIRTPYEKLICVFVSFPAWDHRTPQGLEDVSKYPYLFAELLQDPTWSEEDLRKLAGLNFLRVFRQVEKVFDKLHLKITLYTHIRNDVGLHTHSTKGS